MPFGKKRQEPAEVDQPEAPDVAGEVKRLKQLVQSLRRDQRTLIELGSGRSDRLPPLVAHTILGVLDRGLTMQTPGTLVETAERLRSVIDAGIEGSVLEAGTALGGTGIVLASVKEPTRTMDVYDVFAQIPPPGENDDQAVHDRYETIASGGAKGRDGETYYGYRDDLIGEVTQSYTDCGLPIDEHRITLHQGLFEDTLHPEGPVAFALLDGDWYESTMVSLQRITPHLSVGGMMVIDDYHAWSGCTRAVDEFIADKPWLKPVEGTRFALTRTA